MNVRLQYPVTFVAGVYYNDQMRMNEYTLRVWLITNTLHPENHNVALERLKYFIYNEIDSSILINQDCEDTCKKYVAAGLKVTTMPGEPVDQLVGIMLFQKLNAIMEDRMIVIETEVSSTLGDGMIYMHSEHENVDLVVQPDWWTTADLVHYKRSLLDNDNVVTIKNTGIWRELDLAWPDEEVVPDTGNTIVFGDFDHHDTK